MNERVYTKLGKGIVIASFEDGTYCVRLDSGGGVILMRHEIFTLPKETVRREPCYSMAG